MIRLAILVGIFAVVALTMPAIMLGSASVAGFVPGEAGRFTVWCASLVAGLVAASFADPLMQERKTK